MSQWFQDNAVYLGFMVIIAAWMIFDERRDRARYRERGEDRKWDL